MRVVLVAVDVALHRSEEVCFIETHSMLWLQHTVKPSASPKSRFITAEVETATANWPCPMLHG